MGCISRELIWALVALFVVTAPSLAHAQGPGGSAEAQKLKNPVASTPKSIAAGSKVFRANCRPCHGSDATGNGGQAPEGTQPPDLTDAKWDRGSTDGEIFVVIRDGAGPKFDMKGFRSTLTAAEMWSVINYLRSLRPKTSH